MLRFTPIRDLNDPFECRSSFIYACSPKLLDNYILHKKQGKGPYHHPTLPKDVINTFDSLWNSQNQIVSEQKIRESNELLAEEFSHQTDRENYIDNIGILSLSSKNDNPTMWAHYSSAHTGFVIGFDTNHAFFQEDLEYEHEEIEPGEYSSYITGVNRSAPEEVLYFDNWAEQSAFGLTQWNISWSFMLKKSKSWGYENEWRLIEYGIQSCNDYGLIGLFDCPVETIKVVYLGLHASDSLKNIAIAFRKRYPKAVIEQAYLANKSYHILFQSV